MPFVPRDFHLEKQLRPEWVYNRGPLDGLPSSFKGLVNRVAHLRWSEVTQEPPEAVYWIDRYSLEMKEPRIRRD